ncbi:MAG: DUF494 domain-containing protein [Gammaproteobacteria bacterium]|nr:DUF494 domain-containing protein [Gammaproteobacteria bacterium]
MKENVLDVLMYLFENYMDDEEDSTKQDKSALTVELQEAGFHLSEIDKAISWLEGLSDLQESEPSGAKQSKKSFRVFSEHEKQKLNRDCMGFIYFMDNIGAFDQHIREIIIDRVMALETPEIDLEQLKWVILLVLFNQPGHEATFEWIEDVVFDEVSSSIH